MGKAYFSVIVLAALAACTEPPNDAASANGSGVGFGSYSQYQAEQADRDAALAGGSVVQGGITTPTSPTPTSTPVVTEITPEGAEVATTGAVPSAVVGDGGFSQEQDFDAVSGERSIESDAERVAANRAQYRVIQPGDVPTRPGDAGPNIVAYALATNNPVGAQIYQRRGFNLAERSARNCATFASADQAQQAFLAAGGPQRDRQALDPDGDGYACAWDPSPFRGLSN